MVVKIVSTQEIVIIRSSGTIPIKNTEDERLAIAAQIIGLPIRNDNNVSTLLVNRGTRKTLYGIASGTVSLPGVSQAQISAARPYIVEAYGFSRELLMIRRAARAKRGMAVAVLASVAMGNLGAFAALGQIGQASAIAGTTATLGSKISGATWGQALRAGIIAAAITGVTMRLTGAVNNQSGDALKGGASGSAGSAMCPARARCVVDQVRKAAVDSDSVIVSYDQHMFEFAELDRRTGWVAGGAREPHINLGHPVFNTDNVVYNVNNLAETIYHEGMHVFDNINGISAPVGHNIFDNAKRFSDRIYSGARVFMGKVKTRQLLYKCVQIVCQ